ncbi:thiamine pyrophosphate-dependent dehydrogenase E1 component subunit alpha [Nocardia neocaledoniensis]|uniref:thiamine pyrophosphate-dependent dehydrogenase E1 component subunit alpha n=1 Tax=Nocardia neocaledoniensis TaxID=236511 RepID=UPI0024547F15|nr:thiamine pyrophosphate-dependent dehydrogenase E1 component subunit alpha [Nocardia neocaledoniensis]
MSDSAPPLKSVPLDTAALKRMYSLMLSTTLADQKSAAEARAGRLMAAFYPVRGMEAVCAALGATMRREDKMVSTYRNLGDAMAKGMSLRSIIAELYGKVEGCSRGRGGPMHLQDQAVNFTATTGIVGSGMQIAAGLGMAEQMARSGSAVIVTFGDGATSIGAYHEGMNFVALWKLPVVIVCQNNQWGEHTAIADYAPVTELAKRAAAYGITSERVDGFDPMACVNALENALARARANEGPTFLEFMHYRLTGHTGTADFSYVPKDELEAAMRRDPAPNFRAWLLDNEYLSEQQILEIEAGAEHAVEDAFQFAVTGTDPDQADIYEGVFADESFARRASGE